MSKPNNEKHLVLLDGGTGLSLMKMGHSFIHGDPLWSAAIVQTHPQDLIKLHKEFFTAGADIVVTATYQATVDGYVKQYGISKQKAVNLVQDSVKLAQKARDEAYQETGRNGYVAASIGPLGATLSDMSEYHGKYAEKMTKQELSDWHFGRMKIIVESQPDLMAIETIPIIKEAEAIVDNLSKFPWIKAWITFQCKDGEHTAHGEHITQAIRSVASHDSVIAVGVNCVHLDYVTSLVKAMADLKLSIPIIVKPNGKYSVMDKTPQNKEITDYLDEWVAEGASWIGGCCYIYPTDIADMKFHFAQKSHVKFIDPGKFFTNGPSYFS